MIKLSGPLIYCDKCNRKVGGLFIRVNSEFWCSDCIENNLKELRKLDPITVIIKSIIKKYETL